MNENKEEEGGRTGRRRENVFLGKKKWIIWINKYSYFKRGAISLELLCLMEIKREPLKGDRASIGGQKKWWGLELRERYLGN